LIQAQDNNQNDSNQNDYQLYNFIKLRVILYSESVL